jgi:hypothetical protein
VNTLPVDLDAERSVLAELVEPLYRNSALDRIAVDDFADYRHRRILEQLHDGEPLTVRDAAYLAELCRYAWPLSTQLLDSFLDCAARRRRLLALERERLELLGGPA